MNVCMYSTAQMQGITNTHYECVSTIKSTRLRVQANTFAPQQSKCMKRGECVRGHRQMCSQEEANGFACGSEPHANVVAHKDKRVCT